MRRTLAAALRTVAGAALAVLATVSCPNPIDEELLLVVDDETAPLITVTSPSQNSLYRYVVDIDGTIEDHSGAAGTEPGYVRRLAFTVAGNPTLSRVYTFERDGSWSANPADPTFAYDPAGGSFSFSVDTAGLTGMQFFTFALEDLNANVSQQVVTLLQDPVGPALSVTTPVNGSSWPLLLAVGGTAVNQSGATAGDRIARLTGRIAGIEHQLDLALLTLQGDGRYHGEAGTPAEDFWFEPATGAFGDSFDLSGESGNLQLQVEVADLRGMTTTTFLTLFDNNTGPEIVLDDATHPCPDMYSSVITTGLTILGWVDPTNLKPGSTQYIVVDSGGWQLSQGSFTPVPSGDFSFPFILNPPTDPGKLTVHVYAKDNANRTTHATHEVLDDPVEPDDDDGPFSIASGATYANNVATSLTFTVTDTKSGMGEMRFNNDGGAWSGWVPYGAPYPWTLAAANGNRTVNAQFSDQVGNVFSTSDTIFLDTVPPTVTFTVAGGAGYATARAVTLQVTATDPAPASGIAEMRFHNDGEGWTDWETWAATKAWTLRDQDGTRTVYAEVRDTAGNVRSVSDDIVLDRSGPTGTLSINGGAAWTGSTSVTLAISASDAYSGVTHMRVHDSHAAGAWQAYDTSRNWTLENVDGDKTVYVDFRDGAGNEHINAASDTIGLDTEDPTVTLEIEGGATTTPDTLVTLAISTTDPDPSSGVAEMKVWDSSQAEPANWSPYAPPSTWTLPDVPGTYTITIRVRDSAGNTDSDTDSITYSP